MPDYDVFISYAWKDNTPVELWDAAREDHWVRCFKFALQDKLNKRLVLLGQPPASIFFDASVMDAGVHLDSAICEALDSTLIFLPLISPWYVHSTTPYCKLERDHFKSRLDEAAAKVGLTAGKLKRIVGVLLDGVDGLKIWKEHFFSEVLAFNFFEKVVGSDDMARLGNNGIDKNFLDQIDRLVADLCKRIIILRRAAAAASPQVPEKGRVFFAAVPGHLEPQRTELVNVLKAEGWTVLPPENECEADILKCEQWVTNTIATQNIQAYIQIIDDYPWKPGQHDAAQLRGAAKASEVELMMYRLAGVDLTQVADVKHRAWLETLSSKTVPQLRVDLPAALQQMLVKKREAERIKIIEAEKLKIKEQAAPTTTTTTVFITVSAADDDILLAGDEIFRLGDLDVSGSIGSKAGEGLEESFDEIDGLLTVYGNEDYTLRVFAVINRWRTILAKRRLPRTQAPPFGILILPPPPGDKEFCLNRCIVPRMHRIPHGNTAAMDAYLADVRAFVTANRLQGGAS